MLDQLATGLQARGHDVVVRAGGPVRPADAPGPSERPYPVHRGGGDLTQYGLTPLHHRRLGRDRDVIVDVSNGMSFFTPLFDRSVPTVSFVHHVHTDQWPMYFPGPVARLGRFLESEVLPRTYADSLCVTVSPSTAADLEGLGLRSDHLRVLPPAAEISSDRMPDAALPTFVALGRLTVHKRVDLLLEAWAEVRPHCGGRLLIVGDGPERARLETVAADLGFDHDAVQFTGRVDDATKAKMLSEAWALVHPAAHEGWGLVITEAGLASTPSLGFDVAGVRDAIDHEVTGLLAADRAEFVAGWRTLASDPTLRRRLGAAAQIRSQASTLDTRVDTFEAVLEEAVYIHGQRSTTPSLGMLSSTASTPAPMGSSTRRSAELSIVVPAYNEAARLPALLDGLRAARNLDATEVIVVDDGSSDDTAAVAERCLAEFPQGRLERLGQNAGKGAALRHGVGLARGEFVLFMDADLATDLADMDPLLAALEHAHVAIGSRVAQGSDVTDPHIHRRLMGASFNKLVRTLTKVEVKDSQCGFKAFRGGVARLLFALSSNDGFGQDVELLDYARRLGLVVSEVPVRWQAIEGSKVHVLKDSARMAASVGRLAVGPTSRSLVPVVSVCDTGLAPEVMAKELASAVRVTDAVFIDLVGAHALLPGVGVEQLPLVADRVAETLDTPVRTWTLDGRRLLHTGGSRA